MRGAADPCVRGLAAHVAVGLGVGPGVGHAGGAAAAQEADAQVLRDAGAEAGGRQRRLGHVSGFEDADLGCGARRDDLSSSHDDRRSHEDAVRQASAHIIGAGLRAGRQSGCHHMLTLLSATSQRRRRGLDMMGRDRAMTASTFIGGRYVGGNGLWAHGREWAPPRRGSALQSERLRPQASACPAR